MMAAGVVHELGGGAREAQLEAELDRMIAAGVEAELDRMITADESLERSPAGSHIPFAPGQTIGPGNVCSVSVLADPAPARPAMMLHGIRLCLELCPKPWTSSLFSVQCAQWPLALPLSYTHGTPNLRCDGEAAHLAAKRICLSCLV